MRCSRSYFSAVITVIQCNTIQSITLWNSHEEIWYINILWRVSIFISNCRYGLLLHPYSDMVIVDHIYTVLHWHKGVILFWIYPKFPCFCVFAVKVLHHITYSCATNMDAFKLMKELRLNFEQEIYYLPKETGLSLIESTVQVSCEHHPYWSSQLFLR